MQNKIQIYTWSISRSRSCFVCYVWQHLANGVWISLIGTSTHTHTHAHTFSGLFSRTTWVSQHQKGKPFWILLKQETMGGSGISWTICKSFAPHSRQITTPVPHHSIFLRAGCSSWCPTNSVKALKADIWQKQCYAFPHTFAWHCHLDLLLSLHFLKISKMLNFTCWSYEKK